MRASVAALSLFGRCPPVNLSWQTDDEQRATHKRCAPVVKVEQALGKDGRVPRFCGRRLPRPNPCWEEGGRTFCLPAFHIIGARIAS